MRIIYVIYYSRDPHPHQHTWISGFSVRQNRFYEYVHTWICTYYTCIRVYIYVDIFIFMSIHVYVHMDVYIQQFIYMYEWHDSFIYTNDMTHSYVTRLIHMRANHSYEAYHSHVTWFQSNMTHWLMLLLSYVHVTRLHNDMTHLCVTWLHIWQYGASRALKSLT